MRREGGPVCAPPYASASSGDGPVWGSSRSKHGDGDPNMASNLSRFRAWAKLWRSGLSPEKRTEITVEVDRVLIIRRRRSIRGWCAECSGEVDLVGEVEAEALTGMSGQTLRDHAQTCGWHVLEGEDGTGLVCLQSLLKSM